MSGPTNLCGDAAVFPLTPDALSKFHLSEFADLADSLNPNVLAHLFLVGFCGGCHDIFTVATSLARLRAHSSRMHFGLEHQERITSKLLWPGHEQPYAQSDDNDATKENHNFLHHPGYNAPGGLPAYWRMSSISANLSGPLTIRPVSRKCRKA